MKSKITALTIIMLFALIICNVSSAAETNYTTFPNETSGANAIILDSQGNVYITGQTSNTNFTVTEGAYKSNTSGGGDIFVSKYTSNGTLIYSTFFGGTNSDYGSGITLDSQGNIYISGRTQSTDFPTTPGAYQTVLKGEGDLFIVKLSADGSELLYSTYLGGSSTSTSGQYIEKEARIAIDSADNIYITGQTSSADFPTTGITPPRSIDTFLSKFDSNWNLVYSIFLGGSSGETPYGIVIDSQDNIWITGQTSSSNFPTTPDAYKKTLSAIDAFISKFNPNGTLIYSSYFGGSSVEYGSYAITIDSADNIYITGQTQSSGLATPGAYKTSRNGADAYVAKFNSSGSLIYCTYFGGSSSDDPRAITVDDLGNVYIAGMTFLTTPTTPNAVQSSNGGGKDAFVAKFNSNGSILLYGSMLGGTNDQWGYGIVVDNLYNLYIAGTNPVTKIKTAPTVNVNPAGGVFNTAQNVTLSTPDSTTTIYYTTDESDPRTSSTRSTYTNPITINKNTTLKYAALDDLGNWSPTHTAFYNLCNVYVTITSSKTNPQVGDKVTYTFKLGNKGPDIAKDVVFTFVIPEGMEYAGADKDLGAVSYNETTRTLTWTLGDVAVGDPYLWLDLNILSAGIFNINPTVTVSGQNISSYGNIDSLIVNAVSASSTVNAATETVPMQATGMPLAGLTMALLMIGSGLALSRKK